MGQNISALFPLKQQKLSAPSFPDLSVETLVKDMAFYGLKNASLYKSLTCDVNGHKEKEPVLCFPKEI
jgi:hypothetical protein